MTATGPATDSIAGPRSFEADTAVVPHGDGAFRAELSDRWDRLGGGPLGGYSLAVALRSLEARSSFPDLLCASAYLLRPAEHGAASIGTEQVRLGRSVETAEARFVQGDTERLRVLADFADLAAADGPSLVLGGPPSLPAPEDCRDPFEALRPSGTVADRVEYRVTTAPGWLRGEPTGDPSLECWVRFADRSDVDLVGLAFLVDAVAPVVLELGAASSSTIELTLHWRARPAPGWLALRASTRFVTGGYHEEDVEIWDSTGVLVAQSRQLALLVGTTRHVMAS